MHILLLRKYDYLKAYSYILYQSLFLKNIHLRVDMISNNLSILVCSI